MQLTKMATGITPAKRKKHVSLSCVLDMLDESPAKRRRTVAAKCEPEEEKPKVTQPTIAVRRKLSSVSDIDEEDNPIFESQSFYNAKDRAGYLSPVQRKNQLGGDDTICKVTVSRSAGPKINVRSQEKRRNSSSKSKSIVRKARARNIAQRRLPLKETSSITQEKNKMSVIQVKQNGKSAAKDELRFTLNVKPVSTPVMKNNHRSKVPGTNEYDFDEPLTWDVEKTTPVSEKKKFFKHRPSPGSANSSLIENGKSTSVVVRQGFKLKFIHHRGEETTGKEAAKGRRNSLPARVSTSMQQRKNAGPISASAEADMADDAMMRKLKEELTLESNTKDLYAYASSSDESQSSVTETKLSEKEKTRSSVQLSDDYTPDLFSQTEEPLRELKVAKLGDISPKPDIKASLSSDSAIHTGPSVEEVTGVRPTSPDLLDDGLSSGRSSPSVLSEISAVSPTPSDTSGPSFRTCTGVVNQTKDGKKLFPIFAPGSTPKQTSLSHLFKKKDLPGSRKSPRNSPNSSPRITKLVKARDNKDQLIIDAGQKRLGASQCEVCGMIYTMGDTVDEATHAKFHQILLTALKFPGWKKERVVQEFPEDGGRVLLVLPDDPKYAIKKVEEINKIMAEELGFSDSVISFRSPYKVFFYISDEKKVVGCCVAEPVSQGYRVIPDAQSPSKSSQPSHRPWCCQTDPELASVGVSRIWVFSQARRMGVATKLLECVRHWFEYGVVIEKEQVAFSDPTPDGKQLATKYSGTPAFLVYKYN